MDEMTVKALASEIMQLIEMRDLADQPAPLDDLVDEIYQLGEYAADAAPDKESEL